MSANDQSIDNLTATFDRFQDLVGMLSDEQLAVQSLCPDWDVRGVILHVLGIENCMVGWMSRADDEAPPFDLIGPFITDHGNDDGAELAELTERVFDRRRDDLAALSSDDFDRRCMTPVGPATYGAFVNVRNFDIWVHHRDITTPLGLVTDDSGPSAEAAMDQIHQSLGYIFGKKVGLTDGMSVVVRVHGPVERNMAVSVDGRAKVVDELDGPPSVELDTDSLTFIQLACGRIDPDAAVSGGRISWTGDDEWGDRSARSLAFTI